jgi:hypothetical protein
MKNIVINLTLENYERIKNKGICLNCIFPILKILNNKQITELIESDFEYIRMKKEGKKNFRKNEHKLLQRKIKVDNETYNKLNVLKEHLDISKNFIVNKILEKVLQ